jgi:lipopolysaccharide/colanic/teichoic acid biosynthesis glycosyltransferase
MLELQIHHRLITTMKRLLDILLSGLGILVFLPFGIPIALILLLTG